MGWLAPAGIASLLLSQASHGSETADTTHCSARVIVRSAKSKLPIPGAYVLVRMNPGAGRVPAGSERRASTDGDGIAEFASLPPGQYDVHVGGVNGRRESRDRRAPPPRTDTTSGGVIVIDPFPLQRRQEVRSFETERTWCVGTGDCSDSLVVAVGQTKWRRVTAGPRKLTRTG